MFPKKNPHFDPMTAEELDYIVSITGQPMNHKSTVKQEEIPTAMLIKTNMTTQERISAAKTYLGGLCEDCLQDVLSRAVLIEDLYSLDLEYSEGEGEEQQKIDRIKGLEDHVCNLLSVLDDEDYESFLLLAIDWLD
jgi:hypothetical protein